MDHDETIVIYELQANRSKVRNEIITFDFVVVRVPNWIGLYPFLKFCMQLFHNLTNFFRRFLEASCRVKSAVYSAFNDIQAAHLPEEKTVLINFRETDIEVVDTLSWRTSHSYT